MTTRRQGPLIACILVVLTVIMHRHAIAKTPSDTWFSIASVLSHDEAFAGAHDVELSGNVAFVPGKGGAIAIVDIADVSKPKLLWFKRNTKELEDSETVLPVGKHLLLGTRDFLSMDVSNPRQPVFLKTVADRTDGRIDRINGMVKRGNCVFAANKAGWIDVFDVTDITSPTLFGALEVRKRHGLVQPHDVDAFGDSIVIVAPNGFGARPVGHIAIFKVMDDAGRLLPADTWTMTSITEDKRLIGANRVQISGPFAYTGGSWSPRATKGADKHAGLGVIDISDPKKPRIVAAVPFSDTRGPNGLTVAGKVVFLAGGQSVDAIDISDPHHPVKLGAQTFPRIKESKRTDNAHDLIYRDGHLYVSCQTDSAFMILKIDDKRILDLANARPASSAGQ